MKKITRGDIHIISRFSNWNEELIDVALQENEIISPTNKLTNFIKLFIISVGVSFLLAGIIFFFAYNWNIIHKAVKLSIVEGLLIGSVSTIFFIKKLDQSVKNLILTGASVLVGSVFAVYGQIYQTGADEYDLFLLWTLCITIWVLITEFEPLRLIYITLLDTTIILYTIQIQPNISLYTLSEILFILNTGILIGLQGLFENNIINLPKKWFTIILALSSVTFISIPIINGIIDDFPDEMLISVIMAVIFFVGAVWYAVREKEIFYIALIPTAVIVIITTLIGKLTDEELVILFLLTGLFVTASFTLLIRLIIKLKKQGYE